MAATTTRTAATIRPAMRRRDGSAASIAVARAEHRADVVEGAEGAIALGRAEGMVAEPRELEEPGEGRHRRTGDRQPVEGLAHELHRGEPRRAAHAGGGGGALEARVAPDDGAARVGLPAQVLEALVHRDGHRPRALEGEIALVLRGRQPIADE